MGSNHTLTAIPGKIQSRFTSIGITTLVIEREGVPVGYHRDKIELTVASPRDSTLPQPSSALKVVFGPFEFDPALGALSRHGYKVRLPAQPAEVLSALVKRPGELVTREDLRALLWPGVGAGDFEHGVNSAVNKLRQILGDAANQPRYIETFPGRGYRFVAPVRSVGDGTLELVPSAAVSTARLPPMRRGIAMWVGTAAALIALVVAVELIGRRPSPRAAIKASQLLIVPPKGYSFEGGGVRQAFAVSPDGERVAFTAKDTSGSFRLFLREFSELDSRPVADGEGAYSVVWTPDGGTILFAARGKLRRIAVNGTVSQILSNNSPYFSSAIPFGHDRLLVSNHRNSAVIPSSGGVPHAIDPVYSWAQMLPGGREFLYTFDDPPRGLRGRIAPLGGNDQGVEVVQADSRVEYTGSLRSDGGYLVYLRGGTLLAQPFDLAARHVTADPRPIARHVPSWGPTGAADFSVSERGVLAYQSYVSRSQFIWVNRTGKRLSSASPAGTNASYVRLSPDGRWLAAVPFDIERGVSEIWLYDAMSGVGRKLVFGPEIRHVPVWSPDSRNLVHVIDDHAWPRLGLSSIDGTPDKQSLPNTGFMAPTDWSPDGRFILYTNSALPSLVHDFPSDVFAIDMDRHRKVIPLLTTPFYESRAVFSPNGRWLAFLSNESGEDELYIQALDRGNDSLRVTGERFLISRQGAQCLRWRKDGSELYYLGFDGRVYAVPLHFRSGEVHARPPQPLFTIDPEALASFHSPVSFDVSADGTRFVIPSMTPGESSALVVLRDWESLVAK
jgi:DNA-binding winged helix-turn-helix (wHTH) protein/Tol biopolymer transport system component